MNFHQPWNTDGKYAYVFNLFTEPEYRRKGIATRLLKIALDHAKEKGITFITLHASDMGKPLFISQGFNESNEMSIKIEKKCKHMSRSNIV